MFCSTRSVARRRWHEFTGMRSVVRVLCSPGHLSLGCLGGQFLRGVRVTTCSAWMSRWRCSRVDWVECRRRFLRRESLLIFLGATACPFIGQGLRDSMKLFASFVPHRRLNEGAASSNADMSCVASMDHVTCVLDGWGRWSGRWTRSLDGPMTESLLGSRGACPSSDCKAHGHTAPVVPQ